MNVFFLTPFLGFLFILFYLLLNFLPLEHWTLNSWIFFIIFHLFSKFLFFVLFRMLWMLVTVNKLKHVVCHGSHTSQITTTKTLATQTFFSMFNEKSLSWSHTSWLKIYKTYMRRTFSSPSCRRRRKK